MLLSDILNRVDYTIPLVGRAVLDSLASKFKASSSLWKSPDNALIPNEAIRAALMPEQVKLLTDQRAKRERKPKNYVRPYEVYYILPQYVHPGLGRPLVVEGGHKKILGHFKHSTNALKRVTRARKNAKRDEVKVVILNKNTGRSLKFDRFEPINLPM